MRRLLSLALLLIVACGKTTAPPVEPPPEGGGDAPPSAIQGSLVVHVPVRPAPEVLSSAFVVLGDGSRFRQPLDANGTARFEDPSIVGPQDVSVVFVKTPASAGVEVYTLLGFEQPEAWLDPQSASSPELTKQSTFSGKVTGASDSRSVEARVAGDAFLGGGGISPDGTFSFDVRGTTAGQTTLFAKEYSVDYTKVVRAGIKRGLSVGGGQPVSGLEVALDHPVNQTLDVGVDGLSPYGTVIGATLFFFEGNDMLFYTEARGPMPLRVPTVARTAPFDATRTHLSIKTGDRENLPGGSAEAELPVASTATSATVKLMVPSRFNSPTVGTRQAPGTTAYASVVVDWTADPEAQMVRVGIVSAAGQYGGVFWNVWAPPSITSFKPFALPMEGGSSYSIPRGLHAIEIEAITRGDAQSEKDYFNRNGLRDYVTQTRKTKVLGYVNLK